MFKIICLISSGRPSSEFKTANAKRDRIYLLEMYVIGSRGIAKGTARKRTGAPLQLAKLNSFYRTKLLVVSSILLFHEPVDRTMKEGAVSTLLQNVILRTLTERNFFHEWIWLLCEVEDLVDALLKWTLVRIH